VAGDLQRKGYVGKTIGIKLRFDDFQIVTRDQTIDHFTADAKELRQFAGQCLKRAPLQKRLRLLGVRVGALLKADDARAGEAVATRAAQAPSAADALTGQLF
jgi:DNA polymerase-4